MNKNQEEMKNTISEMKIILEGNKTRLHEAENHISELEDKVERNTLTEQQNEKSQNELGQFKGTAGHET